MSQQDPEVIPVTVVDYLEEDPPIRGQKWACVSLLSPNDAIASKDAFAVRKFLEKLSQDITEMFGNLEATFADTKASHYVKETMRLLKERHAFLWDAKAAQEEFYLWRSQQSSEIDEAFHVEHGQFKTSIQGIKIRGVYDSQEEARSRSMKLFKINPNVHVYLAQVGMWCPWNPYVNHTDDDSEYDIDQLNTLMKKYNESQQFKKEVFDERKDACIKRMSEERDVWLERTKEDVAALEKERLKNEASTAEGGNAFSSVSDPSASSSDKPLIRDDLTFLGTNLSDLMSLVKETAIVEDAEEELQTELNDSKNP